MLKELKNFSNSSALDDAKNNLMDEPKIIDGLSNPKDNKKDSELIK